jgi:hypothetical protein
MEVTNGTVVCRHCHKEFTPRIAGQVFCSRRCRERDKEKRHDKRRSSRGCKVVVGEARSRVCPVCGSRFEYVYFGGCEKMYCSVRCATVAANRARYDRQLISQGRKPIVRNAMISSCGTSAKQITDARIGRALAKANATEARAESSKARARYYADHPEEYARLVEQKMRNSKERRDRKYAHMRSATKKRERCNLARRVITAKRLGITVKTAVCECCGDTFEYVAERYKTDGRGHVTFRCDFTEPPKFCSDSCREWHKWDNGGRERRAEREREKAEKKRPSIVSTWRGQYSDWYFRCGDKCSCGRDDRCHDEDLATDLSMSLSAEGMASYCEE